MRLLLTDWYLIVNGLRHHPIQVFLDEFIPNPLILRAMLRRVLFCYVETNNGTSLDIR